MSVRCVVDHSVCQGHGRCILYAPEIFNIREDDGRAVAHLDVIPSSLESNVRTAAAACPERAITILDEEDPDRLRGRDA